MADSKTTAIDGAGGNDVIIGGPNVVLVTGGDGWDYLVGNSVGAIMVGGSGDDIIDAGAPPLPDEKSPSVDRQIELAASLLPDPEASEWNSPVSGDTFLLGIPS